VDVSSIAAKPTCVVADDHPPVLEGIARYLGAQGYRVVGLARNGYEAVTLIESLRPSLAVLDLRMPGLSGAGVVRQVARTTP
jgi:DNA-binding NarL/FixJ family response regulator